MNAQLASRMRMAKQKAEAFLRKEGMLEKLPIDPIEIAHSRNIMVRAKPDTEAGVSGMLLRHGNQFGILYATHISSVGFQRFSIAHELGHYFLEGHVDHVLKDGMHTSHSGYISADPFELEADAFASGLLLPETPVKRVVRLNDPGLATIEKIATQFQASLTATAIRYAELTDDAVAVVISTGANVDYCFLSDAMKGLPRIEWLRKGAALPCDTCTDDFNSDPRRVQKAERAEQDIDVRAWLGGTKREIVTEEVIGLGSYGKTLTVLSSKSIGMEDEAEEVDDDEELTESWTPRFHR